MFGKKQRLFMVTHRTARLTESLRSLADKYVHAYPRSPHVIVN